MPTKDTTQTGECRHCAKTVERAYPGAPWRTVAELSGVCPVGWYHMVVRGGGQR